MSKPDIEKKAKKEIKKLKEILKNLQIPDEKVRILDPIITNTCWMKVKLDEAIEAVKTAEIVVEYNNGGGQSGYRENPWFKGYEALWKSYMLGMARLLDALPDDVAEEINEEVEKPQTVLDMVRDKHRKRA